MKPFLALALVMLLSACQGTGGAGSRALNDSVDLPADYQTKAAVYLASDYARDAIGPAEILAEPRSGRGLVGASSSVLVRYPVRTHSFGQQAVARGWLLDRMEKSETGMRCITLAVERSMRTGGDLRFSASRPNIDGAGGCDDGQTFVPYAELTQMAGRLKTCRAPGEERCLLSSNMPEAEARRLMNQR